METKNVNKLEALGLIVGPVLALLFFLLEPGGILIDPAEIGDAVGTITALASNRELAHISALLVPPGLVMMLFGLAGINRVIQGETMPAALSRLSILCVVMGATGWILTAGLTHVLAQTSIDIEQSIQQAIPIYRVDSAITLLSGVVVSTGVLAFSLGMSAIHPPGFSRNAALVIAAVSLLALVAFIIGQTGASPAMISVARACYFPWVAWFVMLGVKFLKGSALPPTVGR